MRSNYLAPETVTTRKNRRGHLVILFAVFSVMFTSLFATSALAVQGTVADDSDKAIWEKVICKFPETSVIRTLYNMEQTTDLEFSLFSKSAIAQGGTSYDSGLNGILNFVNTENGKKKGQSFKARNERILGLEEKDDDIDPIKNGTEPTDVQKINRGKVMSFYDRFGVAGLNFSSYGGEWRHYWIDACDGTKFNGYNPTTTVNTGSTTSFTVLNANSRSRATIKENLRNMINATPSGQVDVIALQEQGGMDTLLLEEALPGFTISRIEETCVTGGNNSCLVIASNNATMGAPTATGSKLLKPASVAENFNGRSRTNWPRYAYWATFENGSTVINAHLQVCTGGRKTCSKKEAYKNAIDTLAALATEKASTGTVVVTGDFNDGAHTPVPYSVKGLQDAGFTEHKEAGAHPNHTFYSSNTSPTAGGNISRAKINKGLSCGAGECYDHVNGAGWGTYGSAAVATSTAKFATWNILGAGHTDAPGCKDRCDWADSPTRTANMLEVLKNKGVSVAMLQEVHGAQANQLKNNPDWEMYPKTTAGYMGNRIIWKKSDWTMVGEGQNFFIHYHQSHSKKRGGEQGFVTLQHNVSGQQVNVMSVHNTVNRNGANYLTRYQNLQDELLAAASLDNGAPTIIGGDFNDHANKTKAQQKKSQSYCVFQGSLNNAFGPPPNCAGNPNKRPRGASYIDHIYGSADVSFTEPENDTSVEGKARKISDHPVVTATLNFGVGQEASTGGNTLASGLPTGGHGQFYDNRLIPRSTWDDIHKSKDPRTKQFSQSGRIAIALQNTAINWIFMLAKAIVVFTIAFIGLCFTDIAGLLGITDLVVGKQYSDALFDPGSLSAIQGNTNGGIVGVLYKSLFANLVAVAFLMTAINIGYRGLVKREFRGAFGVLAQTVGCFLVGVIIFSAPHFFITLPNTVAVTGQALVASTLTDQTQNKKAALCYTEAGAAEQFVDASGKDVVNVDDAYGILEQASITFRSAVGCKMWESLLLRPWVEGQFHETSWKTLNGKKYVLEGNNRNTAYGEVAPGFDWVGKPKVPRGGGEYYENWALFQLSAQTNVHSPFGYEKTLERAEYTQDVATDWWRVVDAVSNYQEDLSDQPADDEEGSTTKLVFTEPLQTNVMPQWETWVGNDAGYRFGTASSAILVALIVSLGPLVLAGMAIVYAIGLSILMMVSPIFFLFGCWGGRGWEIFKAWGQLVLKVVIWRIVLGLLVVVLVRLLTGLLAKIDTIGYWQTILLMVTFSLMIILSRHKIMAMFNGFQMSSIDLGSTAGTLKEKTTSTLHGTGRAAGSVLAGGVASRKSGGTFGAGMLGGIKAEATSLSYRGFGGGALGAAFTAGRQSADAVGGFSGQDCGYCGSPLGDTNSGFSGQISEHMRYGYIHYECGLELDDPENMVGEYIGQAFTEEELSRKNSLKDPMPDPTPLKTMQRIRRAPVLKMDKTFAEDEARQEAKELAIGMLSEMVTQVGLGYDEYQKNSYREEAEIRSKRFTTDGARDRAIRDMPTPEAPEMLAPYIDERLLANAYKSKDREAVQMIYLRASYDALIEARSDIKEDLKPSDLLDVYADTQKDKND